MKKFSRLALLFCFLILGFLPVTNSYGQTFPVNDQLTFEAVNRNMWGPGSAFSLNFRQTLFNVGFPYSATTLGGIGSIAGFQVGAQITIGAGFGLAAYFEIAGFSGGKIDVLYPIDITLDVPSPNTFDKGQTIVINSDYTVQDPPASLDTEFPQSGQIGFYIDLNVRFSLGGRVCLGACINLPNINVNVSPTITLFEIALTHVTYPCVLVSPCGGTGRPPCIPSLCTTNILPATIDQPSLGITLDLDIPNTQTTSSVEPNKCLLATGEYTYIVLTLDLLRYLEIFAGFIPPPAGPIIQTVIGNLSNTFSLPMGIEISYTIFSAHLQFSVTNRQRFTYCPTIMGNLEFPTTVQFFETDPNNGNNIVRSGVNKNVPFKVGNDIHIVYPCNFDWLDVESSYSESNEFTNKTYDSLSVNIIFKVLEFEFNVPGFTLIPRICFPRICIPYPSFCGWSPCIKYTCTPAFCTPALVTPPINIHLGPLYNPNIQIAAVKWTYFEDDWEIIGTETSTKSQFKLVPKDYYARITGVDILCYGDTSGQATVTVYNGEPPFTYDWSNGTRVTTNSNSNSVTGLPAGINYVIVTNDYGCVAFEEIYIEQPQLPLSILTSDVENALCNNSATGSISVTMQGGTAPYSYNWSPGGIGSRNNNNLSAGTYDLTVTDANSCEIISSYIVGEPEELILELVGKNVSCNGGKDASIRANVRGGTQPYRFNWSNGATTQHLIDILAGSYTLTVTDTNNCQNIQNIIISEPNQALSASLNSKTDVLCYGASTGALSINVNGGTPPYRVFWSALNSGLQFTVRGLSITGLPADTYLAKVVDTMGCSYTVQTTISQPASPLTSNISVTNVLCSGESTGALSLNVRGGTPPYSFTWSNGSNNQNINSLAAGVYFIEIEDASNCILRDTATITEPLQPLSIQSIVENVSCNAGRDGSIKTLVSGGTPPYAYYWSNADTTSNIEGLSQGSYTLTVTDANSCEILLTETVSEPDPIVLIANHTDVTCYGASDGSAEIQIFGGRAPYRIKWVNSNQFVLNASTRTLNNITADTYTAIVTDKDNCNTSIDIQVTQPNAPIEISYNNTDVSCYGGNDGEIVPTVTGGTAPYSYAWSNGTSGVPSISNLSTGSYFLSITDFQNCLRVDSIYIGQPEDSLSIEFNSKNVSCFGGNDAFINIEVFGGTAPYSYLWVWSSGTSSLQNIENIEADSYTLQVTDAHSCTFVEVINITEPAAPLTISSSIIDVSCYGGSDGQIFLNVTGGTMPYTYYWSNSSSIVLSDIGPDLRDMPADIYTVIVTDTLACVDSSSITISQPSGALHAIASINHALCNSENQGSISLDTRGGTPPYTYNWSNGETTATIDSLYSGKYNLTITDNLNCIWTETYSITEPSMLKAETDIRPVACKGASTGELKVKTSGGTPPYTYNWSNGETTSEIFNLPTGTYTLSVSDSNGCEIISGGFIEEPATPLTLYVSSVDVTCFGAKDGRIGSKVFGGTPPYEYFWGDTLRLISNQSENFENVGAGQYLFRVIDANGCEVSESVLVKEPTPVELILQSTDLTCFAGSDGTAEVKATGGTAPYRFLWSTGDSTAQVSNLSYGTYAVVARDTLDCLASDSIKIFAPDELIVSASSIGNLSCFNRNDASIQVEVSGGYGIISYNWSNGETTKNISNLAPGDYTVTVSDQNNCSDTLTLSISQSDVECLRIPNSFTPNGDGKNDTWELGNFGQFPNMQVSIFNKWGNLLYKSDGYATPWDGTVNGNALPSDTYYYIIDLKNGTPEFTGPLTIVR